MNFPLFANIYSKLSRCLEKTADHFVDSGELVKQYCGSHFKYTVSESETYTELLQYQTQLQEAFQKKESQLFLKKEKLFRSKDIKKWACDPSQKADLASRKLELFNDR